MHLKTSKQQLSLRYKALGTIFSVSSIILIAPHTLALGQIWSGGFPPSVTANLYWTYDPSTVSTQYLNTYIGPAVNQWNGISSKVLVSISSIQPYRIKAFTGKGAIAGVYGEMLASCPSGVSPACNSDKNWQVAAVTGYENVMTSAGFNTTNRVALYAHEFGHALSMAHVTATVNAAMLTSGKLNYGVQQYDKDNLKSKWGQ